MIAAGRPPPISTLPELHVAINETDILDYTRSGDGHRLMSIYCPNKNSVLVTTRRQLNILRSSRQMHADAIYKVVPTGLGRQLFTIHANWGGYVRVSFRNNSRFEQGVSALLILKSEIEMFPLSDSSFLRTGRINRMRVHGESRRVRVRRGS